LQDTILATANISDEKRAPLGAPLSCSYNAASFEMISSRGGSIGTKALPRTNLELDLESAWQRIQADADWQLFEPAFDALRDLVESSPAAWFADIQARLSRGEFRPSSALTHSGFEIALTLNLRQPVYVEVEDGLIFTSGVAACIPALVDSGFNRSGLAGPFLAADVGGQWAADPGSWFDAFELRTRRILGQGARFVATADIAGFFGQIRHDLLGRTLVDAGCPRDYVALLLAILGAWFPSGRGLPWTAAAHILAAAYLSPIDRKLEERGWVFARLVDDYRLFFRTHAEAEAALSTLTALFEELGLTANPAKTSVRSGESLLVYPTSLIVRRMGSRLLAGLTEKAQRAHLVPLAEAGRRLALRLMKSGFREYLAQLLSEQSNVDTLLTAAASGQLPGAYLGIVIRGLKERSSTNVGPQTVRRLEEVALTGDVDFAMSAARRILLLLAERQHLPRLGARLAADPMSLTGLDSPGELRRVDALLFAALLPGEVREAILQQGPREGYLIEVARRRVAET
jgi:hypothetical protein